LGRGSEGFVEFLEFLEFFGLVGDDTSSLEFGLGNGEFGMEGAVLK